MRAIQRRRQGYVFWKATTAHIDHETPYHLELGCVRNREDLASGLGTLAEHLGRLRATDTSTPLATLLLILVGAEDRCKYHGYIQTRHGYVQVGLRRADEGGELTLVLTLDVLDAQDSSSLLVNDRAETSLPLHNDVGNTHLAAECGEEDDELDGVDIMSNDDKRRLLGLDEGDGMVETVLDKQRLLGILLRIISWWDTEDFAENVPWPGPPSPRQSPWQERQDEPSSPASSQDGTCR